MSENDSIDDLWDAALRSRNFIDGRNGEPSLRALAAAIGINASTISNMRSGTVTPKPSTVQKVADALGLPVTEVSRWVGQARTVKNAYMPPVEADLLDDRERKAVDEIIRLFAAPKIERAKRDKAETDTPASQGSNVVQGKWGDKSVPPPSKHDLDVAADSDD
ncbi:helix-turn-helix domain-containing protein [Rhodococcoides fascians]|uniref:helix-turn-helix domain-containing protein n=1 Tax=Rhodococcoides fascians TaxID=1828 RepID=UPI0005636630|nr:helix-turn-helix transcriptional regulator [Rhodococcus fascians]